MKRFLGILLVSVLAPLSAVRQVRLPDGFYTIEKSKQPSLFDPTQEHSIFYVLVPESAASAQIDQNARDTLIKFTNNNKIKVPASFFTASFPQQATKPLSVYFDWIDTVGTKNLKTPGKLLAEGLDYLHTAFNGTCIVVTQGRGSLVANYASGIVKHPIAVMIQLGATATKDQKHYIEFAPASKGITTLYTFYSEQPFVYPSPTLHPKYTHTYTNLAGINHYNTLLLTNNKQPLQKELFSPLVGKNILDLCYHIKKQYRVNHELFASLSTIKPNTNLLVGIKTPAKNISKLAQKELAYSNRQIATFTQEWKRSPKLNLASGERSRNRYRFKRT